jgi:hypothetical protein
MPVGVKEVSKEAAIAMIREHYSFPGLRSFGAQTAFLG